MSYTKNAESMDPLHNSEMKVKESHLVSTANLMSNKSDVLRALMYIHSFFQSAGSSSHSTSLSKGNLVSFRTVPLYLCLLYYYLEDCLSNV